MFQKALPFCCIMNSKIQLTFPQLSNVQLVEYVNRKRPHRIYLWHDILRTHKTSRILSLRICLLEDVIQDPGNSKSGRYVNISCSFGCGCCCLVIGPHRSDPLRCRDCLDHRNFAKFRVRCVNLHFDQENEKKYTAFYRFNHY